MGDYFGVFEEAPAEEAVELPVVVDVPQPEQEDRLKAVRHAVVFPQAVAPPADPADPVYQLPPPAVPARTFPFTLDPFQQKAAAALERGESVLVAAHTSAGKTAVAEYAIALCLRRGQRVVYTSPIKALSNQKYRDLTIAYQGEPAITVGLMTGDTTVQREARVLVMTTEVLRNMLQQSAELLRELGCVVFDEVHYMRNAERGLVWEDCIGLLDSKITFVLLSATVPNAAEFASWVAQAHQKVIHVVYTEYRPVPLCFYVAPAGSQQCFQLFTSDDKRLNQQNFNKAILALPFNSAAQPQTAGKPNKHLQQQTVFNVLRTLFQRAVYPIIVFSFGKQKCEDLAAALAQNQDFASLLTTQQREMVAQLFDAALLELAEEDRQIRQIQRARVLLMKGIAVHHSGLLPFVKEISEILFQEDLVKIIFVTETFAMGLNLPARCVVFSELKKFDGQVVRYIQSGEFIQMAGRAGRRGKDVQGLVVSVFADQQELESAIQIMQGQSEPLNSAYRLSYNSLINYYKTEGVSPEAVIRRSFKQFQRDFKRPRCAGTVEGNGLQLRNVEDQARQLWPGFAAQDAVNYYMVQQGVQLKLDQLLLCDPGLFCEYLRPGRLVGFRAQLSFAAQAELFGVMLNKLQIAGGVYVDLLVPSTDEDTAKNDAPTLQYNKILPRDVAQRVQLLEYGFGREVADALLDRCKVKVEKRQMDDLEVTTEITEYLQKYCPQVAEAYQIRDASLRSIVFTNIAEIIRKSPYLHQSAGAREFIAQLPKYKCSAKIIRINVNQISSVSKYYLQKIPTNLSRASERGLVLEQFNQITQMIGEKFVETVVSADQQIRGRKIIEQVLLRQNELFKVYQIDGVDMQLILDNKIHQYISTHPIIDEKLYRLIDQAVQTSLFNSYLITCLSKPQMVLQQELHNMTRVLKQLEYISADNQVTVKGQIAAQVNAVNELIITESLFDNIFENMSVQVFAGVLCGILSEGGSSAEDAGTAIDQELQQGVEKINKIIQTLMKVVAENDTVIDQYILKEGDAMNVLYAQVAYQWANGDDLNTVCEIDKTLFEGNVIRILRRLITCLEQVQDASVGWNEDKISQMCAQAIKLVNRGLVRADSLYIVQEQDETAQQ